jgi:hypothetical protein
MKVCSKCGKEKELNVFPKNKKSKDGHGSWCYDCCRELDRNRPNKKERNDYNNRMHHLKKQERLQQQHEYHKIHREEILDRQLKNRIKNGEKYKAHHRVYNKTEIGKKAIARMNNKRRSNGFGFIELFPNVIDTIEHPCQHHLIDKKYVVWIPDDLHRLFYAGRDREKHCEYLNPIIKQLYPNYEWNG